MKNHFERFHPLVTFSYYLGALAMFMLMLHPIFLASFLLVVFVIHFIHDRCRTLQRWFFFMIATGLMIIILNPIFIERGRTLLFEVWGHRFTLEAFMFGVTSALSIVGVIALFVSFNEMMTPNKLLYLFAKFLPQFAILLMLTLRFIPLMRRRLDEISAVQASKGISVREGTWGQKAKAGLLYVQVLLTYSLEEAIQTADSMKARGYGQGARSTYEYFRFKKKDAIALIFLVSVFIGALYGRFLEYGYLTIYPEIETLTIANWDAITLIGCLLLFVFPILVEIGGFLKWHKWN